MTESWLCLTCNQVLCGRYAKGHMQAHWESHKLNVHKPDRILSQVRDSEDDYSDETYSHCIAVSLSDLSVWCYECDQYIKHGIFDSHLYELETLKFGSTSTRKKVEDTLKSDIENNRLTGFFYSEHHQLHKHPTHEKHYESPNRINEAFERLIWDDNMVLSTKCRSIKPRLASKSELLLVHHLDYVDQVIDASRNLPVRERIMKESKDVFYNEYTYDIARLTVASVIDMTMKVDSGELRNGLCLVRPPGHHALPSQAGGFCIFNNVSIAACSLLSKHPKKRILILDWDVHHGNGIQEIFYESSQVLYISVHRYEHQPGYFYADEGKVEFVGKGDGEGFNVNIPLYYAEDFYGDDDYYCIFEELVMPISREFNPDIVLVASGFDAGIGDPMGEFKLSPKAFGQLTHKISQLAGGKLVLSVEGGYNVDTVSGAVHSCLSVLTGLNKDLKDPTKGAAKPETRKSIDMVKETHSKYWKCLSTPLSTTN
eukprot:TRINITY_DN2576_c1_g2_i2.p1 TRINITY_DN2576_c1_g2~~TRINITY_DN2576_c1_g2_i2.p1  ORF type:complete len:521 (+),score=59.15 TRINITY_DN2576_c1_g2_i2:113-1564(+)